MKFKCKQCGKDYTNRHSEFCSAECYKEFMIEHLKNELPPKYRGIFTDRRKDVIGSRDKSLYIYGDVGTGKTVFAWSLYLDCKSRGGNAKFLNFSDYCRKLRSMYKDGDPHTYANDVDSFDGLLILDDVGAEKSTDFITEMLYLLVNYRYEHLLQTVIVSNLSMAELSVRFNARITSRLGEMCEVIKFSGKDRRLK